MGNRMSSLPIAQFCGQSPRLSKLMGAGRAAACSSAFHAICASDPKAADMFARLTNDERKDVLSWKKPADVILSTEPLVLLDYASADKEVAVALDAMGECVDVASPDAISVGHLDMGWVRMVNGARVAYIGDVKKTQWTTTDGPDSLQLLAYAFAFASKHGCSHFCCGIWMATEGEWNWGPTVDLYDLQTSSLWERVRAAAMNDSEEYATGTHCGGCWQRLGCPAHAIRGLEGTTLAPLTTGLTRDNALEMLMKVKAAEDLVEKAMDNIKAFAKQNGGIEDGQGKVYKAIKTNGRSSIDSEALKKDGLLEKYTKAGTPSTSHRWVKA